MDARLGYVILPNPVTGSQPKTSSHSLVGGCLNPIRPGMYVPAIAVNPVVQHCALAGLLDEDSVARLGHTIHITVPIR